MNTHFVFQAPKKIDFISNSSGSIASIVDKAGNIADFAIGEYCDLKELAYLLGDLLWRIENELEVGDNL